jgi:hypothetical protein
VRIRRFHATLAPVLFMLAAAQASAQTVVRGRVLNGAGEPIPAVDVRLERTGERTILRAPATDTLGSFIFGDVAPGRYLLRADRIGFASLERAVTVGSVPLLLELTLDEAPVAVEAVTAEGERTRERFETEAGLTVRELSRTELKLIPGLAEADVLRAVEVLPGVVSTSDFSSSYNVRGGSADQNLIQLDGIPIYNPFHVGGLFSVFNADMVERAELLAGGFPAEYGGRVSSVLNVVSDAGDPGMQVSGGVSVLATRVSAGADLPMNGRIRVGARRSYFDQLLRPFFEFPYYLHDLQLTSEVWPAAASRLSVTAYWGDDVLDFGARAIRCSVPPSISPITATPSSRAAWSTRCCAAASRGRLAATSSRPAPKSAAWRTTTSPNRAAPCSARTAAARGTRRCTRRLPGSPVPGG